MRVKPAKHSGEVVFEVSRRDEPLMNAMTQAPWQLKKIVVPIDFSECSKKALQYALALAEQQGAALTLVYVVPSLAFAATEYGGIDSALLEAEMCSSGEKELREFGRKEVKGRVASDTIVRSGSPSNQIIDVAQSLSADMIVISTHGRSGLKHVFMGSVAEEVVRHAPCPVLVVREQERECLPTPRGKGGR